MKILILIIFLVIIIILFSLFLNLNKVKKNIGQKISFLYNKIYKLLILEYYKTDTDLLKEEIIDYYNTVVIIPDINKKIINGQKYEKFIKNYFVDEKKILKLLIEINGLVNKDYNIVYKTEKNILYLLFVVIILLISILYVNYL